MKLTEVLKIERLSRGQSVGLALVIVGILLLILTYNAQSRIDEIGSTNDPVLRNRALAYEDQRNLFLVTSIGTIFMGLFAIALLGELSMPALLSQAGMVSTARMANDTIRGLSLKGNACYLPSKHGLTRERVLILAAAGAPSPPSALSDELVVSPGNDGSSPGMVFEPLGLRLLDQVESELNTKLDGAGLEAAEGTLQILKHGFSMMKDFHFKERDGKTILRVEYSGLLEACRTVRKEKPDTCRQLECVGCSCLLTAASRAAGKVVSVDSVDNGADSVVFTLSLKDW